MQDVSIIIPFKNPGGYFKECIQSIINQTYTKWELVAINDHSVDDSLHVIQSYASKDSRIKVIENNGLGIIDALNTGFSVSIGQLITRMDADDIMPVNRLELMTKVFETVSKETIVTGLVKYFSDEEISSGYQKYERWINKTNLDQNQWKQIYRECVIASPNWMIPKETLLKTQGFVGLQYPEDYDLTLRWYKSKLDIQTVPEITLYWREHPKRTSRISANYNQESFFKLKIKHFIEHDWHGGELVIWGNNPKTSLVTKILKKNKIHYLQQSLNDFEKVKSIENPQILVGIYPNQQQRKQIENYLQSIHLQEGKHWWWL